MSDLIVSEVNGTLVVDSRLVANELGIQHKNLIETIKKYETQIEQAFGILPFQTEEIIGRGQPEKFAYLNEEQATFLMTLSRNTPRVVECKRNLVKAFFEARKLISTVIPQQSERIRELELQLAIATQTNQANQSALAAKQLDHTMLTLHGKEVVLALRGMADQVVETEKPTIEVIDERHNVTFKGQTLVQIKDFIAKKYGIKFKSGAEIKRLLERKKLGWLIAQAPRTCLSDYVPEENLEQVYKVITNSSRQLLLGE